ncbi:MAG: flagellar basal body rod protein FlgB [Candidatus Eremiobacteraeota bacterium]|nr:flagellar basal body rod protein FlgB [Candidatus Eremiobacteraeota bacterium]
MQNILSSPGSRGMKKMLDACTLRQKFILNNIANEKTPDYVAKDIDFKGMLQASRTGSPLCGFNSTNKNHFPPATGDDDSPFRMNGQFVRMFVNSKETTEEEEMVNLAANSLTYRAATDLLSRKFRLISTAITGGK